MSREKIVFSDFDSGLSSDQYLGKDGTVGDCSNLEMRRNARFARLSSVLADSFVGITLDGPIIKMVNAYEYIHGSTPVNQVLAVCMGDSTHGGCIYDETGAKVYSFGATEKIVGWNEIILPNSPSDID